MSARVRAVVWALGWALLAWGLLGPFTRELEANADTERDVLRTLAIIDHGVHPVAGPAIDYLPVALPPTWYYLVTPVLAVSRDLDAIHAFHVLVLLLGVAALGAWRGPDRHTEAVSSQTPASEGHAAETSRGTLLVGLLLGTAYVPEVLASVWHNGLVPGVSALWMAALLRTTSGSPTRAAWAVTGAFACAATLVQVHVVSVLTLLAPSLLWFTVIRRDGIARTWRPHLVTALLISALAAMAVLLLWDLDLERVSAIATARTSAEGGVAAGLVAAVARLAELLTPNVMKDAAPAGAVWLVLATVGAVSSGSGASTSLRLVLAASSLAGIAGAASLSGLDPAPRYYGPALWSVVGLAVLGGRAVVAKLAQRGRRIDAGVRAAVWVTLSAAAFWPLGRPAAGEALRETAIPSANEQAILAATLRDDFGATLADLARLHGPVMNGLSAMRLHAVLARFPKSNTAARAPHDDGQPPPDPSGLLYAGPADFPAPASLVDARRVDGGSGREWVLGRANAASRLLSAQVAGRACAMAWPYRWSALEAPELRPFGLHTGASVEACRQRAPGAADAPLELDVELLATRATLVLGWFDVVRHRPDRARVTIVSGDAKLTRLEGPLWRDLAGFALEVQSTPARVRLLVSPVETLSTVELY